MGCGGGDDCVSVVVGEESEYCESGMDVGV